MEWISSLFLMGYGQRNRKSFFNTYIKKNFVYVEEGCSASLIIAREKQT